MVVIVQESAWMHEGPAGRLSWPNLWHCESPSACINSFWLTQIKNTFFDLVLLVMVFCTQVCNMVHAPGNALRFKRGAQIWSWFKLFKLTIFWVNEISSTIVQKHMESIRLLALSLFLKSKNSDLHSLFTRMMILGTHTLAPVIWQATLQSPTGADWRRQEERRGKS